MTTSSHHRPAVPRLARLTQLLVLAAVIVVSAPRDVLAQADASPPSAVPQAVAFGPAGGGFVLTLARVAGNEVDVRRGDREVLLRFAQAAPAFDAAELQARAAEWLDGVNVGHDAVLLLLSRGVEVQIEGTSRTALTLRFFRAAAQDERAPSPQPGSGGGALRLDLLRARLLLQDRQLAQARERFEALRAASPESADPVAGLAAVESEVGRWRRSAALYREAQKLSNADPALPAAAEAIERAQAGGVRIDAERRRSHGGEVVAPVTFDFAGIEVSRRLVDAWKLGIDVETASIETAAVQRADGSVQPFSGRRERAALFAQHDGLDGTVHVVSLFAGDGTAGAGLSRRQVDDRGATMFVVEAQRLNWDYIEGTIDRARRDRLALARSQRLGRSVSGRAEVGVNRYTFPGYGTVARTATAAAELRLDSVGDVNGLSAAYVLDAEYVNRIQTRVTATGASYMPLPLLDREVHSGLLGYARAFGEAGAGGVLTVSGQLGAGFDRYGRSGPIAAAALSWTNGVVVAQVRGSHTRNVGRSRGTTDAVAGFVSVSF
jgi:hypothetical protein